MARREADCDARERAHQVSPLKFNSSFDALKNRNVLIREIAETFPSSNSDFPSSCDQFLASCEAAQPAGLAQSAAS